MTCKILDCNRIAERNGICATHNREQRKQAEKEQLAKVVIKEIRKVSPKMATALQQYSKLKKQYMKAHPACEVCGGKATQIHHAKGRATQELLLDTNFWYAVCFPCHRQIEENVTWAKSMGYSVDRLAINQKES